MSKRHPRNRGEDEHHLKKSVRYTGGTWHWAGTPTHGKTESRMWPDPTPSPKTPPPANTSHKPPAPKPHSAGSGICCPMVAAGRAAARGRWRLARRYAAWSLRLIAAGMVG